MTTMVTVWAVRAARIPNLLMEPIMFRFALFVPLLMFMAAAALGNGKDVPAAEGDKLVLTLETGFDVLTAYYDRGHSQENQGLIGQPFVGGEARYGALSVFGGTWHSFHTKTDDEWYEGDYFIGARAYLGEQDNVILTAQYRWYTSPEDYFGDLEDFGVGVALQNDGILFGEDLNPYAMAYFETDGALDGIGDGQGVLLTIGIQPEILVVECEGDVAVLLRVPVEVGIGLEDYYESTMPGASGDEDFGYVDVGIELVAAKEDMEAYVGVHHIHLGDNNLADDGEDSDIYGVAGFRLFFGGSDENN
jgi:hypothetical protein